MSWHAAHPARRIVARPRSASAPAIWRGLGSPGAHALKDAAKIAVKIRTPRSRLPRNARPATTEPLRTVEVPPGTSAVAWCSGLVRAFFPILFAGLAGACAPASNDTGRMFQASGEVIAMGGGEGGAKNACFTCHGLAGEGDGASAPRLAGLDAGYLQKQLKDYATGVRADPIMAPIAKPLDDHAQRAVAEYYAVMPPAPAPAAAPPAAYVRPGPDGTPSCADCHGAAGLGGGPGGPALVGQPAAYTLDQLQRWTHAKRRNDPRGVMRIAVAQLNASEAGAIAAWLAPSKAAPPPDSGEPRSSTPSSAQ